MTELGSVGSEESDNEPLSVLAEDKHAPPYGAMEPGGFPEPEVLLQTEGLSEPLELSSRPLFTKLFQQKKRWRRTEVVSVPDICHLQPELNAIEQEHVLRNCALADTFITHVLPPLAPQQQQQDLWLDVKPLSQSGAMACRLCMECFVNKSKLVMHYVLNHSKAYCGNCRYLLDEGEAWSVHWRRHLPLRCCYCQEDFMEERHLRTHYTHAHQLSHCRMCNLMLPEGPAYQNHLLKKHTVTMESYEERDLVWEILNPATWMFSCLLCYKYDIPHYDFLRHFLYHHKFTLKCLASLVNGKKLGFTVLGANLRNVNPEGDAPPEHPALTEHSPNRNFPIGDDHMDYQLMEALIPEIKQEVLSEDENEGNHLRIYQENLNVKHEVLDPGNDISMTSEKFLVKWSGREDFDITMVEFMPILKAETDYINNVYLDMNTSTVTSPTSLSYEAELADVVHGVMCPLCYPCKNFPTLASLTEHVNKQHCSKGAPNYCCRACMSSFHSRTELQRHLAAEAQDYQQLLLCQLCELQFQSREAARAHLASHWEDMPLVECCSPQLGLKCRYCPMLFWHEIDRERHHCEAHYVTYNDQFYKCSTCNMLFSEKIWWASHELQEHLQPGEQLGEVPYWLAYKCGACCRVFRDVPSLREHCVDLHPTQRRIYCAVAGCVSKPFRIPRYLKQHNEVVHSVERGQLAGAGLQCEECGKVLRTQRAATTHRTVVHGHKASSRFKCRICNYGLPSIQDRKLHYLVMHPGVAPFSCSVCGKGYNNKSALYTHRSQSHSVHLATYTCSFCDKIFNKRDSYKEHLLIHVGPRHACPHCSRVFVQRSNMLRHIRLHTGEKPYPCLHCDKTFADKGACNSHIRTHTRQDVHACLYCGQEFLQKQKLKYHLRKHTGEDLETCPVCAKKFTNHTNLREHMKCHDETCPMACHLCNKVFMSPRYWERHMKDSHSETAEVHPCPICGRSCPKRSALRHHLMSHSKTKYIQCMLCGKQYNGKKSINRHLQKRHTIDGTGERYSKYYSQLDPRQCGLGLDEETILKVFGPQKNIKLELPLMVPPLRITKNKVSKVYKTVDSDSDHEYKPQGAYKKDPVDAVNTPEGDGPISGTDLATLRNRAKRESARNIKYCYGSDEDDDADFVKKSKAKNKVKVRRKQKSFTFNNLQSDSILKSALTRQQADEAPVPDDDEDDDREPMFPLVEIKCEPVEYD